jgi:NADH-quinone oxidoreductase subunit L
MEYTIFIILLPLLMFVFLGLVGHKLNPKIAGILGCCSLAIVTILSFYTAWQYFFVMPRNSQGVYEAITVFNFQWLHFTPTLHIDLGIMLDPISVMMLIVISTVSFMVHIYSLGYMHGEKGFQRYFSFLSLFTMSMLGLVVATNIFQMYLFWELVGVSSYLLIGFYYTRAASVSASKKAFIVTRFADLGFLIGILIFGFYEKTFDFASMGASTSIIGVNITGIAKIMLPLSLGLMFIGGAGKSAMFPLHIWLPDAMEGPTPVSALIHAATMVVAGVYLVARMFPLFIVYAPNVLHIIAYVGVFTAFFAATIACVQSDIKRVLAFSTISQIAFMMVAIGVCTNQGFGTEAFNEQGGLGYMASMFHLFTHAMFKACLFLCAGAIIHTIGSNEMNYMGGLRKYMPITHIAFLICCLAISGIFPFSGFFSKDEILTSCFNFSSPIGWIMTIIAGMTAFYMFRLYYCIFWGKEAKRDFTPKEAPYTMTIPLIVLSIITCFAGFIPFGHFISADGHAFTSHIEISTAVISLSVAVISIIIATLFYKNDKQNIPNTLGSKFHNLHTAAYHRFYIDEIYQFITHKVIFAHISQPIAWFDRNVVDGFFNFLGWGVQKTSESIKGFQSGRVQQYTYVFLLGIIIIVIIALL